MDAQSEIERLLKVHNAVLVRQNNHLVYRLQNGQTFVLPKTPSDHRSLDNNLSDLRRALGIVRVVPKEGEINMPITATPVPAPAATAATAPVEEPKVLSLKGRLDAAITAEEALQEKLMAEAQQIERRVHMLKAIQPFVDDPTAEVALRGILPAPEPPLPEPPQKPPAVLPPPAPPQIITERVQVTRQLVLAATQTFEDTFTINDVLSLMTGGRHIDPPERLRVRQSIGQCMFSLCERGEVIKETEHFGRRQALWRKVPLNGKRSSVGVRG